MPAHDCTRSCFRGEVSESRCNSTSPPGSTWLISVIISWVLTGLLFPVLAQKQEEPTDWYKKWLAQDVKYIITAEEKDIFLKLQTESERENFIEQFWRRRDPDPSTSFNEYKEEYFRRIAYANERFKSGIPGWTTDRGRIYIMFGPPNGKKTHEGGHYRREPWEGGGFTAAFPFEVWRYDYIEGVGSEIEIEFVDPSMTGEFRLARNPDEKDALLHVGGIGGMTMAELAGTINRGDRILNQYVGNPKQPMYGTMRAQDLPFERMLRLFKLSRPPEIKFKDLQRVVNSKVHYDQIPIESAVHYIRLAGDEMLVSVTLRIEDRYLEFREVSGTNKATVDIYGAVTSVQGRTVYEFDDTVSTFLPDFKDLATQQSVYQKKINLKPGLYKVELVVRDTNSDEFGTSQQRVSLSQPISQQLLTSAVFLARRIEAVEDPELVAEPFVIGPFKVVPRVDQRYRPGEPLLVYIEIYNFQLDQSSNEPQLRVDYEIRPREGEPLTRSMDVSSLVLLRDRAIAITAFQLDSLEPGRHELNITVSDLIAAQSTTLSSSFQKVGPEPENASER